MALTQQKTAINPPAVSVAANRWWLFPVDPLHAAFTNWLCPNLFRCILQKVLPSWFEHLRSVGWYKHEDV